MASQALPILAALALPRGAMAAYYDPHAWYLSGSLSYDVVNPSELNQNTSNIAPLQGLIGGRVRIERGLVAPDWTHWVELGYFTGGVTATDDTGPPLGVVTYTQSMKYLSVMPLGATYWFARTAYIDFGAAGAVGLALSPSYTLGSTPQKTGSTTTTDFSGGISPIFYAGLDGRFWLNKYLGLTLATGLRIYSTTLTSSGGSSSAKASLTSFSMIGGVTIALGGVKGTGRTYVEVIHTKPDVKAKPSPKPSPNPSPTPAPAKKKAKPSQGASSE